MAETSEQIIERGYQRKREELEGRLGQGFNVTIEIFSEAYTYNKIIILIEKLCPDTYVIVNNDDLVGTIAAQSHIKHCYFKINMGDNTKVSIPLINSYTKRIELNSIYIISVRKTRLDI